MNLIYLGLKNYFKKNPVVKTYLANSITILGALFISKCLSLIWKVILAKQGASVLGGIELLVSILLLLSSFVLLQLKRETNLI